MSANASNVIVDIYHFSYNYLHKQQSTGRKRCAAGSESVGKPAA